MVAIGMTERTRTAVTLGESHFREFKSALQGHPDAKQKREKSEIATDIAQTLVAFANADGGELLVGVEDRGTVTGLPKFNEAELRYLEDASETRIHKETPLPSVRKFRVEIDGHTILYFSVQKGTEFVHLTSDGRCLQRKDLSSVPVTAESIIFDRRERMSREYDRGFVDGASVDDLDLDLVRVVADQLMKGMSCEKCLQYLDLAEYGIASLQLKRAALLLFSKQPARWHPRLQIRILKIDGDSLGVGENYNVVSDETITGNILKLVETGWDRLRPHLVQTKIDKDARFEQRSIYPELACREALLNAIAHRDYSEEGKGIEVYIFNSNLAIRNPGGLLSSITIDKITSGIGIHESRNTHVSRVLRELGYMRELGEGMRRIFELMHHSELASPIIGSGADGFQITLAHKALYSEKDLLWLSQFEGSNLDREEKAIVLLGQGGRVFSANQIWSAVGIVDTEHYRQLVDSLMTKGVFINKVPKVKAKNLASRKRIPFRDFPRFVIVTPGSNVERNVKSMRSEVDSKDSTVVPDLKNRIFVGNLPAELTENELYKSFEVFGPIVELAVPVAANGKSKGYAFIEYEDGAHAQNAIVTDGVEYEGRHLVIRWARPIVRRKTG